MTTINTYYMTSAKVFGNVPYGNTWNKKYHFETDASGIIVQNGAVYSDLATAVQSGDVVRIGIIPAGTEMQDALVIISDAFAGSTTASIGFQYVDGVDLAGALAQDAAYFASALSTASTGVSRKTGVKAPITIPKDAYLILTIGGAAESAVGVMDVIVMGTSTGVSLG